MVIAQSLVARTFGTYTLQLFNTGPESWLVPALGVGLLVFTFLVNISRTEFIQTFTSIVSLIKIVGIAVFSYAALTATGLSLEGVMGRVPDQPVLGFLASMALSILSFKGFTTITNSGSEIKNPHKNIGRAITLSIAILSVIYLFMAVAVSSSLSIPEIVGHQLNFPGGRIFLKTLFIRRIPSVLIGITTPAGAMTTKGINPHHLHWLITTLRKSIRQEKSILSNYDRVHQATVQLLQEA